MFLVCFDLESLHRFAIHRADPDDDNVSNVVLRDNVSRLSAEYLAEQSIRQLRGRAPLTVTDCYKDTAGRDGAGRRQRQSA